ncbi:MAG: redox-regulated ATPase YchF [Flavobacteriales bacterium]|nr:redox-regulated ATPase YchF [Flavobacteriales bacterium]
MKCGIVGLPNVGKSTLFNCLSRSKALAANYPFATIDPNIGIIPVPDKRLNQLSKLFNPQNTISATVEIVDIAGLVKGASKGEGLGNKFLSNIKETNAIMHVLRCFDDDNITHVDGNVNPVRDKEIIDYELLVKDLETLDKKINSLNRLANTGDKNAVSQIEILKKYKEKLSEGKSARSFEIDDDEFIDELQLLTNKPVLYVCNVDQNSMEGNNYTKQISDKITDENAKMIIIAAGIESEINELESEDDRSEFLKDIGLNEPGVNKIIRSTYSLLGLQTFFTAGEKEVRAWTIKKESLAPKAAGKIHTDFEKGFIRAEVIAFDDMIKYGNESKCRENGKIFIEGKNYTVKDGDIIHFRFNV